ncbi:MAG: 30S ribosomal protein S6 [Actinobacteria bacterium]|nr:30S ribosomal protein S6 [Actinomycetota bacterium]
MSNRTYDLVVLLDADAPTDTRTKIVSDAQALIAQAGEVKANKDWGTRQLPYLIDHHEQAAYHVFQFESDPQAISKLDRGLKLTEGVLRFRIFETEPGQELPESPPLFKREERSYERPPREASATPTLDESPAPAAEAPAAETPASEAAAGEAPAAEGAEAPAEAAAEAPAETAAEAPAAEATPAEPEAPAAEAPAEAPAEGDAPAETPAE